VRQALAKDKSLLLRERVARDSAKQAIYSFCADLALTVVVVEAVAASSAVVVKLGNLVSVRTT
jgi:hypothetical protein